MKEAEKYHVLPIDDRTIERTNPALAGRPDVLGDRTSLTLYEGMQGMLENTFMNIKNRSSKITAELEIPAGGANGAILSQGGRFGGWSLYMKDGKPAYTYNFLGLARYTVAAPQALPPGPATVTLDFAYDGGGAGKGGKATLYVNGKAGRRGARREDAAQHLLGGRDRRCRHRQSDAGRRGHRHRRGDAIHRQDQQDHPRSAAGEVTRVDLRHGATGLVYDKLSSCPSNPTLTPPCCAATTGPGPDTPLTRPRRSSRWTSMNGRCARRCAKATAIQSRGRCRSTFTSRSARARASTAAATGSSRATAYRADAYLARLHREIALTRGDVRSRPRSGPIALRGRHAELPVDDATSGRRRCTAPSVSILVDEATTTSRSSSTRDAMSPDDVARRSRISASTGRAWACRISTRRCRPRSIASSRPRRRSAIIDACRRYGLRSVNVDLIYGLPKQTRAGFAATLEKVIAARPDRLAVYSYAHLPDLFKPQQRIDAADLPSPEAKLALLQLAIDKLGAAGYIYIGMDHFALPDDDLALAQARGSLHRNFMGYTTHADTDLVGLGVSAISHIGASFSQNPRDLSTWQAAIDEGPPAGVARGCASSEDDQLRADLIQQLMCQGEIPVSALERRYAIDFGDYFRDALVRLRPLIDDGLVRVDADRIVATSQGRLLLRNIAMCFDRYLDRPGIPLKFSRAI